MENLCDAAGLESVGQAAGRPETGQLLVTPSTLRAFGTRFRASGVPRLCYLASHRCELSRKALRIAPLKSAAMQLLQRFPRLSCAPGSRIGLP
jgi:hypothetical protein